MDGCRVRTRTRARQRARARIKSEGVAGSRQRRRRARAACAAPALPRASSPAASASRAFTALRCARVRVGEWACGRARLRVCVISSVMHVSAREVCDASMSRGSLANDRGLPRAIASAFLEGGTCGGCDSYNYDVTTCMALYYLVRYLP